MRIRRAAWSWAAVLIVLLPAASGCQSEREQERQDAGPPRPHGQVIGVRDTTIQAVLEVAGIAQPMQQATVSTRLAGSVTAVLVQEGKEVERGQLLARIDNREMLARREQAGAALAAAEAVAADARVQVERFRSLYADNAAPKVQLEAAETGLARADAGVGMARAASAELEAVAGYAEVRAPFRGRVTRRFVDPGDFVAPGVPVMAVEDHARLRIVVTLAPSAASGLKPGAAVEALIEREPATAVIEGIVPAAAGAHLQVNAIVENPRLRYQPGGAATLLLPQGTREGILIPVGAIVEQGDLTGVRVEGRTGLELRWVRLGAVRGGLVEVLSGIRSGDRIFVADSAEGAR